MTQEFKPRFNSIQSAAGHNLTKPLYIAERWREYCSDKTELYSSNETQQHIPQSGSREPPPLRSEVAHALRQIADRKAPGPDEVPAELMKCGGDRVADRLHGICLGIWQDGQWPEDWVNSMFIPLPKRISEAM